MTVTHQLHAAAASFWREWHRDLRRHAADVRIPYPIRARLRDAAERALRRSAAEESRAVVPSLDRRSRLAGRPIRLSDDDRTHGARLAIEAGILVDQPLVIVQGVHRADAWTTAVAALRRGGYQVARCREDADAVFRDEGVVDLPRSRRTPQLDVYLVAKSAIVICSDPLLQHAAEARDVPVLRLDAREPFTAYPLRSNGVFTLATAVDLDTGRRLEIRELLSPDYFRIRRNCGYQPANAADLGGAVDEMIDGLRNGWGDSEAQVRFRDEAAAAGREMARDVPELVEWDAAGGFLGAGRLARVQAERAL